jgi:peptide/nickel transport system ATP-binding protein
MSALVHLRQRSIAIAGRRLVHDVSFSLARGEKLALVGESGSGKTLTALSLIGLAPPGAEIGGAYEFDGVASSAAGDAAWRTIRGGRIGFVFQDALVAFNPVRTIGSLLMESVRRHRGVGRSEANAIALAALESCGLADARGVSAAYPHQLSGGQRQRAMIALAIINDPALIIADEPTTALDPTLARGVLATLQKRSFGRGLIVITHDLASAARVCDRVIVMRAGEIVEEGAAETLLAAPKTHYTQRLLAASPEHAEEYPGAVRARAVDADPVVLSARGLSRTYRRAGKKIAALKGVSIDVRRARTHAVMGESGSGKSTLARILGGAEKVDAGTLALDGARPNWRDGKTRRRVQLMLQNPYASLDPTWRIEGVIAEPLRSLDHTARRARVAELLARVGLDEAMGARYPEAFSGGQRQRIALARAIAPAPDVLIADEPVSALDLTIQAEIMGLLRTLQEEMGLAIVLISHDPALVRRCSHDLTVIYAGAVVEQGETAMISAKPAHPYTATLMTTGSGDSAFTTAAHTEAAPMSGCAYAARCSFAQGVCAAEAPPLRALKDGRRVACHFPLTED